MSNETEIVGEPDEVVETTPQRRRNAGFTLIELLIVIAILGILSVVVVISIGNVRDQGENQACKADAQNIRTAAEAYRTATGALPASMDALWNDPTTTLDDADAVFLNSASKYWTFTVTGTPPAATLAFTPILPCTAADL